MMRSKSIIVFSAVLCLVSGRQADAESATGQVTVTIDQAIGITPGTPMSFGTITPAASAGSVILSPSGTLTNNGYTTYGAVQSGTFTIDAEPNTPLSFSISDSTVVSGGNTMALTAFTFDPATGGCTDSNGDLSLNVGATLNVGANQASGAYTGTYTLTVSY